jgi:hypothetical protein
VDAKDARKRCVSGRFDVWRGVVNMAGTAATWSDLSGTAPDRVPDIPVYSIAVDPAAAATYYAGSDVGVWRTTDDGAHWSLFNEGLPNTAVYDLKLQAPTRLLRAGTHGRGVWERLHYDWSDPNRVVMTTTDSNTWGGGSGHTYFFRRRPDGTTDLDAVVVRDGKNLKGRALGLVLGIFGERVLGAALAKTVKAIEARNGASTQRGQG